MTSKLVGLDAWKKLSAHSEKMKKISLKELFEDKERFKNFSLKSNSIFLDYSKSLASKETYSLLNELAENVDLKAKIKNMFLGEKINWTENRAVLHTALRNRSNSPVYVDGTDVMSKINEVLKQVKSFSNSVISGDWKGHTGKQIKHIVNIGIGGSDLGPRMVCRALKPFAKGPSLHFVSNVDGTDIVETLEDLNQDETLFLIASKTFTTQETMTNAGSARAWLVKALGEDAVSKHFVAMTTNIEAASTFGISPENCFAFWDFVGGRYSLWSSIGTSIACYIGFENFEKLLDGAHQMDKHFLEAPIMENIPAIMGLLGVWYNNFLDADSYAVLPYSQSLELFSSYLQQGDMESNGKYVNRDGEEVDYQTGPVIWGRQGTDGQHAFYQLIHQGTKLIPADFIGVKKSTYESGEHHQILLSHFLAQTEALAFGKSLDVVKSELAATGLSDEDIAKLAPHKVFKGNRPTNTIILDELDPYNLGQLIALYEHKIFVQGVVWGVNSFDQWGVELGKVLAKTILTELKDGTSGSHDASTCGLISYLLTKG